MVKIQLDLTEELSKFISIQKEIMGVKDKKETILLILKKESEQQKILMQSLIKVAGSPLPKDRGSSQKRNADA